MARRKPKLSKTELLTELDKGYTIPAICKKKGIAQQTIYNWRSTDPEFKHKMDEIVLRHSGRQAKIHAIYKNRRQEVGHVMDQLDPKALFLDHYMNHYKKVAAADFCGVDIRVISNWMDPEHKDYDEWFAAAVQEIEIRHAWEADDKVKELALDKDSVPMLKVLLPTLPIVGDKYAPKQREIERQVLLFGKEGIEEALGVVKKLYGS